MSNSAILKKLDLEDFIDSFSKFLARPKELYLEGDVNNSFRMIEEISQIDFQSPKDVENLDTSLNHVNKFGVLKIYEIEAFYKIIRYFKYLKGLKFEGRVKDWLDKIIIPEPINEIDEYFDKEFKIKLGINESLDGINQSIKSIKNSIKSELLKSINSAKIRPYLVDSQVHYINEEEALLVRGGFNHVLKCSVISRSSGGFFYVVPQSVSNLKHQEAAFLDKKEEILYKLCKDISVVFNKQYLFLKFINKEFDKFDSFQARVNFAKSKDYIFIKPNKNKDVKLKDFCHPAISNPKPISIDFNKNILMITGVNAGGKTMLLKSILSSIFLSKHLLPMKCHHSSEIGSFKDIVPILDDPQSVKNDISTFAGRMDEFSKLFTKKDMIIGVDEIELGTDSDEAASLFKVILEELEDKNVKIVITTHHKRLASLMAANENVQLLAALYNEIARKPTYEFLDGTIGKSYAFETAVRYNIPATIITKVKKAFGEDSDKLNDLIQRSSTLELELKQKLKKVDEELLEIQRLKTNLANEKEKFNTEVMNKTNSLEKSYQDAIDEVKKAIKTDSKESHRILNKTNQMVKKIAKPTVKVEEIDFKVGDRVKYNKTKGVIKIIKGKKVTVSTDDGFTIVVQKSSLKRSGNIPNTPKKVNIEKIQRPQSASVNLDLHGLRADEAIDKLDRFLNDALINGFDEVLVYHGIGTGKLAYAVKEFLKTYPKVTSFIDAPAKMGGYGAKLIYLG
jgi:DNA mismatch repair protein MutS2